MEWRAPVRDGWASLKASARARLDVAWDDVAQSIAERTAASPGLMTIFWVSITTSFTLLLAAGWCEVIVASLFSWGRRIQGQRPAPWW